MTCEGMYLSLNLGITEGIASLAVDLDSAVKKEYSSRLTNAWLRGS